MWPLAGDKVILIDSAHTKGPVKACGSARKGVVYSKRHPLQGLITSHFALMTVPFMSFVGTYFSDQDAPARAESPLLNINAHSLGSLETIISSKMNVAHGQFLHSLDRLGYGVQLLGAHIDDDSQICASRFS